VTIGICLGIFAMTLVASYVCTGPKRDRPRAKEPPGTFYYPTIEEKPARPAIPRPPHPLLKEADEAVLTEGCDEVRSTAERELVQAIRSVARHGRGGGELAPLTIDYPHDDSIFPPEMIPPTFLWHEPTEQADTWLIDVAFGLGSDRIYVLSPGNPPPAGKIDPESLASTNEVYTPTQYQASAKSWTPNDEVWAAIKQRSAGLAATVTIFGFCSSDPRQILSGGGMKIVTSRDPVGAPIFYRDVPLVPFENSDGVIRPLGDLAARTVTWRLRDISKPQSRLLLSEMPTCLNCHSFAADGRTLGIDFDGLNRDKGGYALTSIADRIVIEPEDVFTWSSFKDKPKDHRTTGLLSRVSPDGQFVVTTLNEALYVRNFLDYKFLQVFYPTRGILAFYSRATGEMKALPGADDPDFVHCGPAWSPDGRYLVFARAEARDPYPEGARDAARANDPLETQIQYDLYRIPFDGGRGGTPELIAGASANGMSNTFPKVSPDGKWIVFVKCRNGQLLRPDGKLWIVPAGGGTARLMRCNTQLMNSWHSFSPNSRWLVFSSKSNTPYTQMFLTHIDENGNDSPAILIPNSTAANRAVNLPEFVNIPCDSLVQIDVPALR
jgi:hypothetical protein